MSNTVIRVENVSKQYRLGKIGTGSISHDLNRWWHTVRGKGDPYAKIGDVNDRAKKANTEYVWALKDVSFDINRGDVVGVIGRNGAGKSTLLKLLSRTTLPTTGTIKAKGRIASLLEVGTGFHPELSGRENIFLNGAILGMTRNEVKSKFDEIVDFAGVERYIDTPVKRYSSGMYVRLAFAVAAHLEPEILIVDEVLAVGDAEFQRKALGKMHSVSKGEGRTVLFVSHNMSSIQALCNQCMYLNQGGIISKPSNTDLVVAEYLEQLDKTVLLKAVNDRTDREGQGNLRIKEVVFFGKDGNEVTHMISGQYAVCAVKIENLKNVFDNELMEVSVSISKSNMGVVTSMSTKYVNATVRNDCRYKTINFVLARLPLMNGSYRLNVMIRKSGIVEDWIRDAKAFNVENGDYYGTGLNMPESHSSIYIDYSIALQ